MNAEEEELAIQKAIEDGIPIINVGQEEDYQIALEVWGKFKVVYPDGREEIVEGKHAFCTCGLSRTKPYCDQTHQCFRSDPSDTSRSKEVKWEFLTNKERHDIMNGIKIDHLEVKARDDDPTFDREA